MSSTEMTSIRAATPTPLMLTPELEALVNSLVQAKLVDAEQQYIAQNKAWIQQENDMLVREGLMNEVIAELNSKLAASTALPPPPRLVLVLAVRPISDSVLMRT